MNSVAATSGLTVRRARPEDIPTCSLICFDAFYGISTQHGFPPDLATLELATGVITRAFSHPGFYCVVAEVGGKVAGSNCLDERSQTIAGIGPITVAPTLQEKNVGRALMEAVLLRVHEKHFAGVRLVQAAFNTRSLSLYARLGFEVREPLVVMQGPAIQKTFPELVVRQATIADIESCTTLCRRVHGHDRGGELTDAIKAGIATVVERQGTIVGYATILGFMGHAVAESNLELMALIGAAKEYAGPGLIVPTRNAALFSWCLENGLRVTQPLNLMALGLYSEPKGVFLPSILY